MEGAELAAVLAGDDPSTGECLAARQARKVPGFDLTFPAPKSVSLLWALADDRVDVAVAVVLDEVPHRVVAIARHEPGHVSNIGLAVVVTPAVVIAPPTAAILIRLRACGRSTPRSRRRTSASLTGPC